MEQNRSGHPQENTQGLSVTPFTAPKLLIFDLDGTLIDSKDDLIASVNATRAHMNLPPLPGPTVASYVGNGAPVLIRKAMGADATDAQVESALAFFLEHYNEHCLDRTRLYPGCQQVLDTARDRAITLAILTNKPVRISNIIIDGLGLNGVFFRIYGGNSFTAKKPDPIGIDTLRAESQTDAARTVMIGDSSVDIRTARNAGVPSVGLTYGLQPESLVEHPPDLLLDRMDDLIPYL